MKKAQKVKTEAQEISEKEKRNQMLDFDNQIKNLLQSFDLLQEITALFRQSFN